MKDQISEEVKKKRAKVLREISEKMGKDFTKSVLGNEYKVIVETCEDGLLRGITPNYIPVQFSCSEDVADGSGVCEFINKTFKVKLESLNKNGFVNAKLV